MYRVIRSSEQPSNAGGTVRFEGEAYGAGVSFFLVNNELRTGPALNQHPYPETWIIRIGKARITADGEIIEVGSGDIVMVSAGTLHKFKNIGSNRLDIICIHAAPRMSQEWLEE